MENYEDGQITTDDIVVNDPAELIPLDASEKHIAIQKEVLNMDKLMEYAKMLSNSTIVPQSYYKRPENCFVALDMATRMGISPLVVMQNLYVIQGKPSWAGSAIAAMLKATPQFRNVDLNYVGSPNTDSWGAYVTAEKTSTGKTIKGGTVTIAIAKKEGWFQKSGSKWQTMPEIMLAYRAYAWFGRVFAPELMMGMQTTEELNDDVRSVESTETVINPYERKK